MRYCVTIELDIDVLFSASDDQIGRAIRTALDQPLTAQIKQEWASEPWTAQDIAVPATTMPCTTSPAAMEG